jgi:hypothetical protein
MNALLAFCAYMAIVRVPLDLATTPVAADQEVWFGVLFHGATAKVLAALHELVYAAGAYGFWRMSAWMWPWAAVYAAQVAVSAAVRPLLYRDSARGFARRGALWAVARTILPAAARLRGRAETNSQLTLRRGDELVTGCVS